MNSAQHTKLRLAVMAATDAMKKNKVDKLGTFIDALHAEGFSIEPLPESAVVALKSAAE